MVLFPLLANSTLGSKTVSNFDSDLTSDFDAYSAIAPPETPISVRSSL